MKRYKILESKEVFDSKANLSKLFEIKILELNSSIFCLGYTNNLRKKTLYLEAGQHKERPNIWTPIDIIVLPPVYFQEGVIIQEGGYIGAKDGSLKYMPSIEECVIIGKNVIVYGNITIKPERIIGKDTIILGHDVVDLRINVDINDGNFVYIGNKSQELKILDIAANKQEVTEIVSSYTELPETIKTKALNIIGKVVPKKETMRLQRIK
ncbi:MAG: hypothetical protein AB1391_00845 [Candidatus Micrarchaeota archaeon]